MDRCGQDDGEQTGPDTVPAAAGGDGGTDRDGEGAGRPHDAGCGKITVP
jgi:hypothetical protein